MIFHVLWRHREFFSASFFFSHGEKLASFNTVRIDEWIFRISDQNLSRINRWVQHLIGNFAQLITFADKIQFHKQILSFSRHRKMRSDWTKLSKMRACVYVNEIDYVIRRRFFRHVNLRKVFLGFLAVTIWWPGDSTFWSHHDPSASMKSNVYLN